MSMKPPTGTPCGECPWRRKSLPGWLGPHTAEEWNAGVHGDHEIACHLTIPDDFQDSEDADTSMMTTCSGSAIHRSNVCKSPRYVPRENALPADRELVFGYGEFLAHHVVIPTRNR
jgi:hypothetical protein